MAETLDDREPEFLDGPANVALGNTFVVRIWSSDGSDSLLGNVHHVRSRKRAYFATRQRLLTFIKDHLQQTQEDRCRS
jgi:hypothetical protein